MAHDLTRTPLNDNVRVLMGEFTKREKDWEMTKKMALMKKHDEAMKKLEYRENERQRLLTARENIKRQLDDFLLNEIEVRAALGGICRQTMLTMIKTERFPAPMHIGSKKYWRNTVLSTWLSSQQAIAE